MSFPYKIALKLLIAFILLATGGFIYFAYRTDTLIMFAWAESLGLDCFIETIRERLQNTYVPDFVKYCLPNALWATSYIIATDTLVPEDSNKLMWAISLPIFATILEVFQAFNIISGTFDFMDVICFTMPSIIYYGYNKTKYHEKNS